MSTDLTFISFSGTTRPTIFGIYDADAQFKLDSDSIVYSVLRSLGSPVLDEELDLRQIWSSFEQATIEYSSQINANHARNILVDMLGQSTGSLSGTENIFPIGNSTEFARKMSMQYSSEIGVGGPYTWFTASIALTSAFQKYDLWGAVSGVLSGVNAGKGITIRKIHHYEPFAMYRFFDTTSVMNYMANEVHFESYSPETIFYMLPIWEDVLRGTQLQLNQRVRRSNYSFDLKGFELTLYPTPTFDRNLYFEYTIDPHDPTDPNIKGHKSAGVVSNISNIAFGHIGYSSINSIGKTWIWRMTVAMCKEILGQIRSKYSSLPIPGGEITLNGPELIQLGREDQANLRLELKELLDQMSYKNLMNERNELEDAVSRTQKKIPLFVWRF